MRRSPSGSVALRAMAAVVVVVAGLGGPGRTVAADPEPAYFAYGFGDWLERIAVAPDGSVRVAGVTEVPDLPESTSSPEVPTRPGSDPGLLFFVSALAPDGRPLWTSYLPTLRWAAEVRGLTVDADGEVWIAATGHAVPEGSAIPDDASTDMVLAKFSAAGERLFARNVGGSATDRARDIALTSDGDAIVVGTTESADFPRASSSAGHFDTDAVALRVRGDGSGIEWARRLGGGTLAGSTTRFDAGNVVVAANGSVLTTITGPRDAIDVASARELLPPADSGVTLPRVRDRDVPSFIVRLDGAGATLDVVRVDFLGAAYGGGDSYSNRIAAALALGPDGKALVAGPQRAARVDSELAAVEAVWSLESFYDCTPGRIQFDPDGRPVVATVWASYRGGHQVLELGPGATVARRGTAGVNCRDLALDARGDLHMIGWGHVARFNEAFPTTDPYIDLVVKLPAVGATPPASVTATPAGPHAVDLTWTESPDPVVRYVVLQQTSDENRNLGLAGLATSVVAPASRVRVEGLEPAQGYGFTVVAEFASGARVTASPHWPVELLTLPLPPRDVVATDGPGREVSLRWTDTNAARAGYESQRRIGDGEWTSQASDAGVDQATDLLTDQDLPVRYRVRARNRSSYDPPSEWVETDTPLQTQPTLRLRQSKGRLVEFTRSSGQFRSTGTLAPADGTSLSFDPKTHDLHVLWGDAREAREFVVVRGDPGWSGANGVWRWTAKSTLTSWKRASSIVLDLPRGAYELDLRIPWEVFHDRYGPAWSGAFAVNLAWGGFSGGDIRAWKRPRRARERWELR